MFTVHEMHVDEEDHHFVTDQEHCLDSGDESYMENRVQVMLTKMMDDKHTFTYKKLVVPMSMRSIYWKYFGFPATEDDEILTKVKIVCILCKTQIAYNRNTSNLRMHLQNKHSEELQKLEATCPRPAPKVKQEVIERRLPSRKIKPVPIQNLYSRSIDGTVSIEGDIHFITDPSINLRNEDEESYNKNVRLLQYKQGNSSNVNNMHLMLPDEEDENLIRDFSKKTMNDAIAEYLIIDLAPTNVVEGKGFQALIATLMSPCEIPGKDKLEDILVPKIYTTFREAAYNSIASIPGDIGLSAEEWCHSNGESYITISIYYQLDSYNALESKVLTTIHISPFIDWGLVFDQFLVDWDLKIDRITAVVMATSQTDLFKVLQDRGLITVPCLIYSLQICTYMIFAQEDVARVISHIRGIIGMISHNPAASTALKIQVQMIQPIQEEAALKMDHPRVWTSTYNMLEAFTLLKTTIGSVLDNIDGIDKDSISLSEADWKIVDDLVTVLEPFKVTMMTLGEEKFPLISLLKPLLWQLNSLHLKIKDTDSDTAQAFKDCLSANLTDRYSDLNVNMMLQTATALDPRFKKLPYASEDDKEEVSMYIRAQLAKFVAESEAQEQMLSMDGSPAPKKSRLSGLEFILGDLCTTQSGLPPVERGALELSQYQSESVAALDDCPLQWWGKASSRCPNLSKLAQKYNCVPASAIPVIRIPVEAQIQFDLKRSTLIPDLIDKLLFLNGNHSMV